MNQLRIGSRVTWFSDEDYWGTVTAIVDDLITVDWGSVSTTGPRTMVRFRHNMGAAS